MGGLPERGEESTDAEAEVGAVAGFGGEEGALMRAEGVGDTVVVAEEGMTRDETERGTRWGRVSKTSYSGTPPEEPSRKRRKTVERRRRGKNGKTHRFNFS